MEFQEFKEQARKELTECREKIKIQDPTEWTMREHSLQICTGWLDRLNELEAQAMQFKQNMEVSVSGLSIPQNQKNFKIKIAPEKYLYDELIRATSMLKAKMGGLESLRKTKAGGNGI